MVANHCGRNATLPNTFSKESSSADRSRSVSLTSNAMAVVMGTSVSESRMRDG
jgi:hypothetical protein